MKRSFKDDFWLYNKPFTITACLALLFNLIWILIQGKADSFLTINGLITQNWWTFFRFYTHIGEGWSLVVLCLILTFVKYRYALAGLISFALGSSISALLKHTLFSGMLRPVAFFSDLGIDIQTFVGVELHKYNTFPSGHAITVFSVFSLLAIITKPNWGYLWAFMALLGIYSRVVLSLHFITDITAGAMIGWLSTLFAWRMVQSFERNKLEGQWTFKKK